MAREIGFCDVWRGEDWIQFAGGSWWARRLILAAQPARRAARPGILAVRLDIRKYRGIRKVEPSSPRPSSPVPPPNRRGEEGERSDTVRFVGAALCGRPGWENSRPDRPPAQGGHTGPPLRIPPRSG